eukprot:153705-Pyramimonas_sp.AAC.1
MRQRARGPSGMGAAKGSPRRNPDSAGPRRPGGQRPRARAPGEALVDARRGGGAADCDRRLLHIARAGG